MTTIRSLDELGIEGPPIRLTMLARLAGYSTGKLLQEVRTGSLHTVRDQRKTTSPHLVERKEARRWLESLGRRR